MASWTKFEMNGDAVAVCRSVATFLILPIASTDASPSCRHYDCRSSLVLERFEKGGLRSGEVIREDVESRIKINCVPCQNGEWTR